MLDAQVADRIIECSHSVAFSQPSASREAGKRLAAFYPFSTMRDSCVAFCDSATVSFPARSGRSLRTECSTLDGIARSRLDELTFYLRSGSILVEESSKVLREIVAGGSRASFSLSMNLIMHDATRSGEHGCELLAVPARIIAIAEAASRSCQASQVLGHFDSSKLRAIGLAFSQPVLSPVTPKSVTRLLEFAEIEQPQTEQVLVDYLITPSRARILLSGFAVVESFESGRDCIEAYAMPGSTIGFSCASGRTISQHRAIQRRSGQLLAFDSGRAWPLLPNPSHFGVFDRWR